MCIQAELHVVIVVAAAAKYKLLFGVFFFSSFIIECAELREIKWIKKERKNMTKLVKIRVEGIRVY